MASGGVSRGPRVPHQKLRYTNYWKETYDFRLRRRLSGRDHDILQWAWRWSVQSLDIVEATLSGPRKV